MQVALKTRTTQPFLRLFGQRRCSRGTGVPHLKLQWKSLFARWLAAQRWSKKRSRSHRASGSLAKWPCCWLFKTSPAEHAAVAHRADFLLLYLAEAWQSFSGRRCCSLSRCWWKHLTFDVLTSRRTALVALSRYQGGRTPAWDLPPLTGGLGSINAQQSVASVFDSVWNKSCVVSMSFVWIRIH